MPEFASGDRVDVQTRFGSAQVVSCVLGGIPVLFLPRHGTQHSTPPHIIDYRAQIAGLKKLGVERIVGVCSVGSLVRGLEPGTFAILGDFIDFTKRRTDTFHDADGTLAHTDFSKPYCPSVSDALAEGCQEHSAAFRGSVVYVGVEGPRYETPSEVKLFASWGGHVVGMTNVPEVVLAREAGMCYGALAVVTNLAAGLEDGPMSHDEVRAGMAEQQHLLQAVVGSAARKLTRLPACTCCAGPPLEFWG